MLHRSSSRDVRILGLYAGHDSHVVLLHGGNLVYHLESERLTRKKAHSGFPTAALAELFSLTGLRWRDIDAVVLGGYVRLPGVGSSPEWYGQLCEVVVEQRRRFMFGADQWKPDQPTLDHVVEFPLCIDGVHLRGFVLEHHLSHAALSYYTGPYASATIVTADGGGDGAYEQGALGVLNKIVATWPNRGHNAAYSRPGIGSLWALLGSLYTEQDLGIEPAGKLMGHAAYGQPRKVYTDLLYDLAEHFEFYYRYGRENSWTKVEERIRAAVDLGSFSLQECMDFSASLQEVTNRFMFEAVDAYRAHFSSVGPLCLGGGVAYNCVTNYALAGKYPELYVPHCPHDGGLGLGAALFVWHHIMGQPFSGVPFWSPFGGRGKELQDKAGIMRCVEDLKAGHIVGWFSGRSEVGKRALGNRSFLVDPRRVDQCIRLSREVKLREWFRPLAPAIRMDRLAGLVPTLSSPYMSYSCPVDETGRGQIAGAVHVDGTCRPQTVGWDHNPTLRLILDIFDQATGVPALVNTSFNRQEPLVDTPEQALATARAGGVQVVYVNGVRHWLGVGSG